MRPVVHSLGVYVMLLHSDAMIILDNFYLASI